MNRCPAPNAPVKRPFPFVNLTHNCGVSDPNDSSKFSRGVHDASRFAQTLGISFVGNDEKTPGCIAAQLQDEALKDRIEGRLGCRSAARGLWVTTVSARPFTYSSMLSLDRRTIFLYARSLGNAVTANRLKTKARYRYPVTVPNKPCCPGSRSDRPASSSAGSD
jgi:hypothetical protein